mmetsp:Transcript_1803/g.2561  ORF Transcript_1803/g.2561 Transcript_1803/m.2561 type:complete len:141 (+) Transcript_1803:87-509(+)
MTEKCYFYSHPDSDKSVFKIEEIHEIMDYQDQLRTMTTVIGVLNMLAALGMITYLLISYMRKHKHSTLAWVYMSILTTITLFTSVGQLALSNQTGEYCNYMLDLVYGFCTIVLFYLSISFSYKTNRLLFDIHQFAKHGRL